MRRVRTSELTPGMITAEDVYNYTGQLILPKGLTLTDKAITRLEFYSILSVRIEDQSLVGLDVEEDTRTHSERIRESAEFKKFHESFDENLISFKESINDINSRWGFSNLQFWWRNYNFLKWFNFFFIWNFFASRVYFIIMGYTINNSCI